MTDDAMDPLIWQALMAAINEKGGEGAALHVAETAASFRRSAADAR